MAFELTNTSSYNVENVLRQNICNSDYYNNTCLLLLSWQDVVDEIYESVEHVEPWMSGNARGPSSAFCLLHRLFTLKLTVREVRALLDHKDSPYIRAVGFLFLRYVCDAKKLWQWCSQYVQDQQEFSPSPGGKTVTMGEFVRDILLEQYYFETIFPRTPKPVTDAIIEELKLLKLPTTAKGNAGAGGADRRGVDDGNKRPASVKASLSVAMGQRAPNRAGGREDRAMGTMSKPAGTRPPLPRSPLPEERARSRSPLPPSNLHRSDRDSRDRGRDDDRARGAGRRDEDRDRYRREADRPRGSDRDRGGDRDRASDRSRDRRDDYDRGRPRDDGGRRDRDGDREADRDRSGRGKDYERGSRERDRDRVRSRSRERNGGGGGRDARDVFRESAKEVARDSNVDAVRARYL